MIEARLRRMQRIVSLQSQLHTRAQQTLGTLVEAQERQRDEERALVKALGEDSGLHGLFVEQSAKRLRAVANRIAEGERQIAAQRRAVQEAGLRLRRAESTSGQLAIERNRHQERKAMEEIGLRAAVKAGCKPPPSLAGQGDGN